jgi:hypothetical protein
MKWENISQGVALGSLIVVPLALEDRFRRVCFHNVGNHRAVTGFFSFQRHHQQQHVSISTPTVCHAIARGNVTGYFVPIRIEHRRPTDG